LNAVVDRLAGYVLSNINVKNRSLYAS